MRSFDGVSVVYFIQAGENGPIKIGTTLSLSSRLASMQTANHERLELLGVVEGDHRVERALHRLFSDLHRGGEWFSCDDRLLVYVATNAVRVAKRFARPSIRSMSPLGEWLRDHGVTQMEFSARSGVPQPLVSKYATGKRRPRTEYALAIEKATDGAVSLIDWAKAKKRAA